MTSFLEQWAQSASTTVGFFWMALWAFILGYALSSAIQIFVTRKRMQRAMGSADLKSVAIGTFFGFISSSCSFSALATTKALFKKGASFIASIAFLLASTNLVIELGIIISVFLGWQFVIGEYVGGILLIAGAWALVAALRPTRLVQQARKNLEGEEAHDPEEQAASMAALDSWAKVGQQYAMEWKMVWKDVTIGFTVAGIIAVFVPDRFFEALFINAGSDSGSYSFLELLQHVVVGPVAAFITFIGSMGNIPLAALLFGKGVSFAGVMAFIFSDLVVFPVLRINAKYYGWKMSLFIAGLLFASLIGASLLLHYGFNAFQALPDPSDVTIQSQTFFAIDYTFFLNLAFLLITGILAYVGFVKGKHIHHHKPMAHKGKVLERVLTVLAMLSYGWLAIGLLLYLS